MGMKLFRIQALSLAVLSALILVTPSTVNAQPAQLANGGMDLHLFRPAVDSKGHLSVNGTDILGHMDFSFGLILDAGFGLLHFNGFQNNSRGCLPMPVDGTCNPMSDPFVETSNIVDQAFTGTLHANLGIKNLLIVGVQLPIAFTNGDVIEVPGFYNVNLGLQDRGLSYQGLGDITIHAKARILRAERHPIGLAAIVRLQLPTGDSAQFTGEPGVAIWPSIVAEYRPHQRVRFSGELGARIPFGTGADFAIEGTTVPTGATNATGAMLTSSSDILTYGPLLTFGVGMSFRVADALDLVGEIYGTQILTGFGDRGSLSLEAIGGIKIFVQQNSYLMLAGGAGIPPTVGFQSADYRATLGFVFEPSIGDRDGDGYKDDVDQCPDEPEDFDNFADEDGCPEPDNDRDGILDVDDECPLVPEDRDGDADEDGCPEGNEGDRDGDGILDDVDECPDDPEDRDGFQDEDGCPDPDNDNDGILDVDDLCPNDPEDMDGFEDQDGCPDPDNDNDRILDVDDTCPNDPETYNGFEDEDGCPDRGSVVIEDNNIIILEKIYFEYDSAVIQDRSFHIIDAVAATLNGNPNITKIEVQGHADERGDDEYNLRLTRDRAASVVEALVQRGVRRDRLRSGGYGERCPVDPRSNPQAWEQNRRVEFKIIETEEGPTGVDVACPAGRDLIPS